MKFRFCGSTLARKPSVEEFICERSGFRSDQYKETFYMSYSSMG